MWWCASHRSQYTERHISLQNIPTDPLDTRYTNTNHNSYELHLRLDIQTSFVLMAEFSLDVPLWHHNQSCLPTMCYTSVWWCLLWRTCGVCRSTDSRLVSSTDRRAGRDPEDIHTHRRTRLCTDPTPGGEETSSWGDRTTRSLRTPDRWDTCALWAKTRIMQCTQAEVQRVKVYTTYPSRLKIILDKTVGQGL